MGIVQEAKAEKSLEALQKMTAPVVKVRREGRVRQIKSCELVPGDIVILEAGNFVPADCRLIESYNLKVEESSLTGESSSIMKYKLPKNKSNFIYSEKKNLYPDGKKF